MGGEAGDGGVGRDVANDGSSGGDNGPLPYLDALDDCCSGAYPEAFGDVDVGTEGRVGGDGEDTAVGMEGTEGMVLTIQGLQILASDWIIAPCMMTVTGPMDAYLEIIADGWSVGGCAGDHLFLIFHLFFIHSMTRVDGMAFGKLLYQLHGLGGLGTVATGEVSDSIEAWDILVICEKDIGDESNIFP